MLQPKRTKHRKEFRGNLRGLALRGSEVSNGEIGLQATQMGWLHQGQIESARKAIVRETKRKGKLWLKVFPHKPYTKKPAEVRMGKGKGDVVGYVAVVKPGRVIFELSGVDEPTARIALEKAGKKLPMKTQLVTRIIS